MQHEQSVTQLTISTFKCLRILDTTYLKTLQDVLPLILVIHI